MTLTTRTIGQPEQYPWGWMLRVDFVDETGAFHHETLSAKTLPGPAVVAAAVEALRVRTEARLTALALEVVEPTADRKIEIIIPPLLTLADQLRALADYVLTLPASAPKTRIVGELVAIRGTLDVIRDVVKAVR